MALPLGPSTLGSCFYPQDSWCKSRLLTCEEEVETPQPLLPQVQFLQLDSSVSGSDSPPDPTSPGRQFPEALGVARTWVRFQSPTSSLGDLDQALPFSESFPPLWEREDAPRAGTTLGGRPGTIPLPALPPSLPPPCACSVWGVNFAGGVVGGDVLWGVHRETANVSLPSGHQGSSSVN